VQHEHQQHRAGEQPDARGDRLGIAREAAPEIGRAEPERAAANTNDPSASVSDRIAKPSAGETRPEVSSANTRSGSVLVSSAVCQSRSNQGRGVSSQGMPFEGGAGAAAHPAQLASPQRAHSDTGGTASSSHPTGFGALTDDPRPS
jgi:hypothetical protein